MSPAPARPPAAPRAFTLVEILISILILALGVLGLGALFPVIIREQRTGSDAVSGVIVSNAARAILTRTEWTQALLPQNTTSGNPHQDAKLGYPAGNTWLWRNLADPYHTFPLASRPTGMIQKGLGKGFNPAALDTFQPYGQGEWYTSTVYTGVGTTPTPPCIAGTAKLGLPNIPDAWLNINNPNTVTELDGYHAGPGPVLNVNIPGWVDLSVGQRLYPADTSTPQFVWDFAVQRVSDFDHRHPPAIDPIRAVVFVRRIDPRIRVTPAAQTLLGALTDDTLGPLDARVAVGEDANGNPTLDGTDGAGGLRYSTIKTCEVEFWYDPTNPAYNHRDRLYAPTNLSNTLVTPQQMQRMWAQMKQPGQKLVDNLGNIYTVVGSGNQTNVGAQDIDGVTGADYIQIDPPVPGYVTTDRSAPAAQQTTYSGSARVNRAIWQVAFTPQIPVSVTLVELTNGRSQ